MIYDRRKLLPLTDTDFAGYKRERQQSRTRKQDDDDFFALLSWGLLGGTQEREPLRAAPLRTVHNSGARVRIRLEPEKKLSNEPRIVTKTIPTARKLPGWWASVLGTEPTRRTNWPTLKPI